MNKKHKRTLEAIFKTPPASNIKWNDIEALFIHLGGELSEGRGSRIRIKLNGIRMDFHKPHPSPDTDKGALKSVRRFLMNAGIKP